MIVDEMRKALLPDRQSSHIFYNRPTNSFWFHRRRCMQPVAGAAVRNGYAHQDNKMQ